MNAMQKKRRKIQALEIVFATHEKNLRPTHAHLVIQTHIHFTECKIFHQDDFIALTAVRTSSMKKGEGRTRGAGGERKERQTDNAQTIHIQDQTKTCCM